jgi:hypothetical protein
MIKRRPPRAGLPGSTGSPSLLATGITAYLKDQGGVEHHPVAAVD